MFGRRLDFKLNFGGIFGAVIGVIAVFAVVGLLNFPAVGAMPIVLAAAGGGALGNWTGNLAMPKPDP